MYKMVKSTREENIYIFIKILYEASSHCSSYLLPVEYVVVHNAYNKYMYLSAVVKSTITTVPALVYIHI